MNWLGDFLLKFEDLFLCKIRDLQHTHSNMAQPVDLSIRKDVDVFIKRVVSLFNLYR